MAGSEIATELLVATGRLPQAVIQVSEPGDLKATSLCKVAQEEGQRDRVGPPREPDEHTAARRAEPVFTNRATDLLMEGGGRQIPNPKLQIPNPKSELAVATVGSWDLGFGIWDFDMPEGGLEPPTPRL